MRLVQPNDRAPPYRQRPSAACRAQSYADSNFIVEGTNWAGPSYRISLRDYIPAASASAKHWFLRRSSRKANRDPAETSNLFLIRSGLASGGYQPKPTRARVPAQRNLRERRRSHTPPPTDPCREAAATRALPQPFRQTTCWLYAPGPKAMYWDEFRNAGIAAIRWDDLGHLSLFPNREAIKARLRRCT
jgi:hypothetical protein